jgi:hypothetical protein
MSNTHTSHSTQSPIPPTPTPIPPSGRICKGLLELDIQSPHCSGPLARQRKQIPIRYWIIKEATKHSTSNWHPSVCEKNVITDCFGCQIQFRIYNKAKYEAFLPEEFIRMCNGPSEVLCDGITELEKDNYYPYTMIFIDKPEWVFYMATDASNDSIDFIM